MSNPHPTSRHARSSNPPDAADLPFLSGEDATQALVSLLAPLPIIIWENRWMPPDDQPRLTYVSASAEKLLGYPVHRWLNEPDFALSIIHPDDQAHVAASIDREAIERNPTEIRYRCRAADGRMVWLEGRFAPVRDSLGRVVGLRGATIDITGRMHAERALQETESRYQRIAETSTEGIWVVDAQGCTTYINQRVTELLGYRLDDLRDSCVMNVVVSNGEQLRDSILTPSGWDGRALHEVSVRHRNGSNVWVTVAIAPLHEEDGTFQGAVFLLSDITAQKLTEEALRRSERQYRLLAENATDVIVRMDGDLRFLYANRAIENVVGLSPSQLVGRTMVEVGTPPHRLAFWREHVGAVLDTGKERTVDLDYDGPIGRRFFQIAVIPEYEEDGSIGTCLCIGRDITERRRIEEQQQFLSEASVLLSTSLDYEVTIQSITRLVVPLLADCCLVDLLNEDGTLRRAAVAHVDPEKEEILHELRRRFPFRSDERYGIPLVAKTGRSEMSDQLPDHWLVAVAEDEEQLRLLRALRMTSSMIVPLTARDRTIGAMMLISSESGRRYTQEDLALAEDLARRCALAVDNARLYREVRQMNRAKDDFLAVLGHELRNPLAAISNALRAISQEDESGGSFQAVHAELVHETRSMARLVEDLLDVARISRGRIRLRPEHVDACAIVSAAIMTVQPLLTERRHQVEMNPVSEPVMVVADPVRLEQVFCNLLQNAARYTPPGGRIRITLEQEGDMAVIRCADNGIGIAPDVLPTLFHTYRQPLDHSDGKEDDGAVEPGLGLGLSLVRSIVEMHGGTVEAYSNGPGHGSEFVVRWPLSSHPDFETGSVRGAAPPPDRACENIGPGDRRSADGEGAARRILLVEDNAFGARMLSKILTTAGYTVVLASDGASALSLAQAEMPDVVLLDIGLPGMDGYEVAGRLRTLPEARDAVLIALTGYGRDEDRARAFAAGFDHHLIKPVDFDALLRLLNSSPRRRVAG